MLLGVYVFSGFVTRNLDVKYYAGRVLYTSNSNTGKDMVRYTIASDFCGDSNFKRNIREEKFILNSVETQRVIDDSEPSSTVSSIDSASFPEDGLGNDNYYYKKVN